MNKTFQTTVLVALLLCSAVVSRSQVVSSTPASQVTTPEIAKVQEALDKVLNDAGVSFKEGLLLYSENNRSLAGGKFNKAVEVFLYSTLNIQKDQKLQGCYNQLVETIYRIEVPNESTPTRVQNLAKTCGWTIDDKLAKSIAKTGLGGRIGFTSQEFKPSPLDELSKLEITPDEQKVDNLVAQKQYISYAAANKSFRFSFKVNPTVQQFIDYYRDSGRKSMEVGLYRSGMFTRMARRIFTEEGVPENITWIGQVTSEWKPNGQQGLWKLSPDLGKRFGLGQTSFVDEIKSFEEATRAAARYLKFLADRYNGNWELAIAAYSSGEKNVDNAIKESKANDYWAIEQILPIATRDFVANVLATIMIADNPDQYSFGNIQPAPPLAYDRIRIPASTNLSLIAQASNTTVQYLRYLNPHLLSNITPPEPYIINVPTGKANEIVALFKGLPTVSNGNNKNQELSASGVRVVKAKAGDTVQKVAERYNANATEIAKYNGLLPNSVLGAGREIKIPSKSSNSNKNQKSSAGGETWGTISMRTGVSVANLKAANPGMKVPNGKVFVPVSKVSTSKYASPNNELVIGPKPAQSKDGKVAVVMSYFNETLHDPYSLRIVRWSPITQVNYAGSTYWGVTVKYRAKNTLGAYVLTQTTFYIRHNHVVAAAVAMNSEFTYPQPSGAVPA